MSRLRLSALIASALLPLAAVQTLHSQVPPAPAAAQIETNRKALNAIFEDFWEDNLKHSPELASTP